MSDEELEQRLVALEQAVAWLMDKQRPRTKPCSCGANESPTGVHLKSCRGR